MKHANQALIGLATVGLLGGSVIATADSTAASADASVVSDPFDTTTTSPASTTTSTSTTSSSTTSTSTTTTIPAALCLGDRVWLDLDGNGVQDYGEPGINGVGIIATHLGDDGVLGGDDDQIFTTQTSGDGDWVLEGIPEGKYVVAIGDGIPSSLVPSFDPDSGTSSPDGTTMVELTEKIFDQDFGYRYNSSIGDTIYRDDNGNGAQDDGESGIGGVEVSLIGPGPDQLLGTPDDTEQLASTGGSGRYLFDNLPSGPYLVDVNTATLPAGLVNTVDEDGNNNSSTTVNLGDNDDHLTADFGYDDPPPTGDASIGDTVYLDLDGNGSQGDGEPGVPSQLVTLTSAGPDGAFGTDDDVVRTTRTDENGKYLFEILPDGKYRVTVSGGIADDGINSGDPDAGIPNESELTIVGGEDNLDQDFGYSGDNTIGDTVWNDTDEDGVDADDASEPRLPGVEVTVTWLGPDRSRGDGDDVIIGVFVTDDDGTYLATELPDGRYSVDVTDGVPAGFDITVDPQGTVDPDAKSTVTVSDGGANYDQDFGYSGTVAPLGSIGDTIFRDENGDGTQDDPGDEPGIAGVTVTLRSPGPDGIFDTADDITTTDETDDEGKYLFDNLSAGEYRVEVDEATLPDGVVNTGDEDGNNDSITPVTLAEGEDHLSADFGYDDPAPLLGSIGDTIYLDANADGTQDDPGDEPGIEGVMVTLIGAGPDGAFGTDDDTSNTTTTDENGRYLFDNLPAGKYRVEVTGGLPSGVENTGDPDGGNNSVSALTLAPGEDNDVQDFGYVGTASIGDTVYLDNDVDGTQDDDETGVSGVVVTVTGAGQDGVFGTDDDIVITTPTNGDGTYLVDGLPAGNYRVEIDQATLPDGTNLVSDPDDGTDDPDGISNLTLASGEENLDQDFGVADLGSIGDTIYLDRDGNGVQDDPTDEPGIEGVVVTLTETGLDGVFGTDDDTTQSTTTDGDGKYIFDELPAGTYHVEVTGGLPDSVGNTGDPDGGNDSISELTLAPGEDNLDQDFGYDTQTLLGDRVWWDLNRDGVQDDGEPGINGVEVTITYFGNDNIENTPDDIMFTRATSGNGDYLLIGISDGNYRVEITGGVPTGFDPTFDDDSGVTNPDEMSLVALADADLDQDFGYAGTGSIGDTIYLDRDGSGTQDDPGDEPGIAGVTVTLTAAGPDGVLGTDDDITLTTTTDEDGTYLFEGLPAGDYTVTVDQNTLPDGVVNTDDPDTAGVGDSTSDVTLTDGEENLDQDFGYGPDSVIGDRVWFDANRDGIQDDDEDGINGVEITVTYLGADGAFGGGDDLVFITTTDGDGDYLVENIPDGAFIVEVSGALPDGYEPTFDADSGINNPDGTSATTLVTEDLDQDFGYALQTSIGDTIFLDRNGDGVQDDDEPGIGDVVVTVTYAGPDGVFGTDDDVVYSDTTDNDGKYLVADLVAGNYRVEVDETTLPNGLELTVSPVTEVTLADGDQLDTVDFGYRGSSSIGDTVFYDADRSGEQGDLVDEPGIEGVTVTLTTPGPDGAFGTGDDATMKTTTDEDGKYLFDGLPPGDYIVTVDESTLPGPLTNTVDEDGNQDSATPVTLGDDEDHLTADFGYVAEASIGDTIYLDLNGDGDQDAGEPGVPGQVVTLTSAGDDDVLGTADDVVVETTTADDGEYLFEDLPDGDYIVNVVSGITDDAVNSDDPDGDTPNQSMVTITDGNDDLDQDFGYVGDNTIGDTIWWDANRDGVDDGAGPAGGDEPRLEGVEVTITWLGPDGVEGGGDDVVLPVFVTDADGTYLADQLPDGTYLVEVTDDVPAGLDATVDPQGVDNPDEQSIVSVSGGEENLDQDFGYAGTGSIGDTVYLDRDGNGTQGDPADEPGVEGVTIVLTYAGPDGVFGTDDDVEFTTITDEDGKYSFDGLPAGDYKIEVSGGLPDSATNSGDPDGGNDSTSLITLADGETNDEQDFGYDIDSAIGDRVWLDFNNDGVQDPGEPGINGVDITVTYFGPDGVEGTGDDDVFTTTTNGDGDWLITDIVDGTYRVAVGGDALDGLAPTYDADSGIVNPDETSVVDLTTIDLDQDFGYVGTSSIGDTIWLDLDGDGTVDPDESGIGGVDVVVTWAGPDGVLGTDDDVEFTVTTDDDGTYLADGLPAGNYSVTVDETTLPDGLAVTFDKVGGTTDPSSTTQFALPANTDLTDVDFGFSGDAQIGDTIYFDRDDNGEQSNVEPGIEGVDVTLTWAGADGVFGNDDDETFTTTTDEDGKYLFDGLPAGEYLVQVDESTLPPGMANTVDEDGNNNSETPVTLSPGENHDTTDFGYNGDGAIGDTIYLDLNGDGVQGADEPGVADQPVTLTSAGPDGMLGTDDDEVFETTTDDDGKYLFDGLPDGDYTVNVTGGIADLADNTGDPDGNTPNESAVTLNNGETNDEQDFGYQGDNALGGTITNDTNGDGVDDGPGTEPGIEGVDVVVTWAGPDGDLGTDDDVVFPPVTTDGNGDFEVSGLPDGTYSVEVVEETTPDGSGNTFDPDDGDENPDGASVVGLAGGETNDEQDFGYSGTGTIGDNVWLDLDGDGSRDLGEPGITGATVTLTWLGPDGIPSADDVVYTTTVDDAGNYLFENLPEGNFTIAITDLPDGLTPTADPDGGGDAMSSLTLAPGETNLDQDFGFKGDAAVGDTVWIDTNGNGALDGLEPTIPGVPITVTSAGVDGVLGTADDIVVMTVTDDDGVYFVDGLPPGPTQVSYLPSDLPNGLAPTSDLDGGTGDQAAIAEVDLVNGEPNRDVDFAVGGTGTLGGAVFEDPNGNGVQDPGEPGIPGVTVIVTLDGPDGPIVIPVVTGPDGSWSLDNLPPGDFTVAVDPTTVPPGVVAANPPTTVSLPDGGSATVDIPAVPTGTVVGRVWIDNDRDGVQDPSEPGIAGVVVRLIDQDGIVIDSVITDPGGGYTFTDVPPGDYKVVMDVSGVPNGLDQTFENDGSRDLTVGVTAIAGKTVNGGVFGFGPARPRPLPTTGFDMFGFLLAALGMMISGGFLILSQNRKRPTAR